MTSSRTILFIGDSITDCGRGHDRTGPNDRYALGCGYVQHIAQVLLADHPGQGLRIYNRGIAGNRSDELAARWERDCLALRPDVVTVLIGVNDTWHRFAYSRHGVGIDEAETLLRGMIERVHTALPACHLVLMVPFLLPIGTVLADQHAWQPEFSRRQDMIRRVGRELDTTLIDLPVLFDQALRTSTPADWSEDGIHPDPGGHALMARAWLRTRIWELTPPTPEGD